MMDRLVRASPPWGGLEGISDILLYHKVLLVKRHIVCTKGMICEKIRVSTHVISELGRKRNCGWTVYGGVCRTNNII